MLSIETFRQKQKNVSPEDVSLSIETLGSETKNVSLGDVSLSIETFIIETNYANTQQWCKSGRVNERVVLNAGMKKQS